MDNKEISDEIIMRITRVMYDVKIYGDKFVECYRKWFWKIRTKRFANVCYVCYKLYAEAVRVLLDIDIYVNIPNLRRKVDLLRKYLK